MKNLINVEVVSTNALCADVCQIELAATEAALPPYAPGDHIELHLPLDAEELVRCYSLVGAWHEEGIYKLAVRRTEPSRGGSAFMHTLKPGDRLRISPPISNFPLSFSSTTARVFLAGGIGITPLIGMIQTLSGQGHKPDLYYAGRSEASMPFVSELRTLLDSRLHLGIDNEGTSFDLKKTIANLPISAELYMCGPVSMLNAVKTIWADSGRDPTALRFETFASGGTYRNEAFSVTVPRLNITLEVSANETLLEALERSGAEPLYNCRKGECGLCAVEVIDVKGSIDHRDVFFSDDQKAVGKAFCSCVSRVAGGSVSIDFP